MISTKTEHQQSTYFILLTLQLRVTDGFIIHERVGSKSAACHPQFYSSNPHRGSFCDRSNRSIEHVYSVDR